MKNIISLDIVTKIFKKVSLFHSIPDESLRLLAFSAEQKQLSNSELLFRQGDIARESFVVLSGEIILEKEDVPSFSTSVQRGGIIGHLALFTVCERPATAISINGSVVSVITQPLIQKILVSEPNIAKLMQVALMKETMDYAVQIGSVVR